MLLHGSNSVGGSLTSLFFHFMFSQSAFTAHSNSLFLYKFQTNHSLKATIQREWKKEKLLVKCIKEKKIHYLKLINFKNSQPPLLSINVINLQQRAERDTLFSRPDKMWHWPRAAARLSPGCPEGDALYHCETATRYKAAHPGWRDAARTAPPSARTADISPSLAHLTNTHTHTHRYATRDQSSSPASTHWDRIQSEVRVTGKEIERWKRRMKEEGNRKWMVCVRLTGLIHCQTLMGRLLQEITNVSSFILVRFSHWKYFPKHLTWTPISVTCNYAELQ